MGTFEGALTQRPGPSFIELLSRKYRVVHQLLFSLLLLWYCTRMLQLTFILKYTVR